MTKKYVLRNVTLLRGRIALCVISSWPVVKFVHGYLLLNVAICMVAKHGVSKQKRCLSLMSAGVKQSAISGICLTPPGQGFCQGLSTSERHVCLIHWNDICIYLCIFAERKLERLWWDNPLSGQVRNAKMWYCYNTDTAALYVMYGNGNGSLFRYPSFHHNDVIIRTLVTLCTAHIWCMCIVIFWHILHLYLYHFIIVPRVPNKHIIISLQLSNYGHSCRKIWRQYQWYVRFIMNFEFKERRHIRYLESIQFIRVCASCGRPLQLIQTVIWM